MTWAKAGGMSRPPARSRGLLRGEPRAHGLLSAGPILPPGDTQIAEMGRKCTLVECRGGCLTMLGVGK